MNLSPPFKFCTISLPSRSPELVQYSTRPSRHQPWLKMHDRTAQRIDNDLQLSNWQLFFVKRKKAASMIDATKGGQKQLHNFQNMIAIWKTLVQKRPEHLYRKKQAYIVQTWMIYVDKSSTTGLKCCTFGTTTYCIQMKMLIPYGHAHGMIVSCIHLPIQCSPLC